jgi:hypothetical protein
MCIFVKQGSSLLWELDQKKQPDTFCQLTQTTPIGDINYKELIMNALIASAALLTILTIILFKFILRDVNWIKLSMSLSRIQKKNRSKMDHIDFLTKGNHFGEMKCTFDNMSVKPRNVKFRKTSKLQTSRIYESHNF